MAERSEVFAALGQEDLALVELQDRVPARHPQEDPAQVLLHLRDVRAQFAQAEDVQRAARLLGVDLGRQRLAHAGPAAGQHDDTPMLAADQVAEQPFHRRVEDALEHADHARGQVQPAHGLGVELVGCQVLHVGVDVALQVEAEDAHEGQAADALAELAEWGEVAAQVLLDFQLRLDDALPRRLRRAEGPRGQLRFPPGFRAGQDRGRDDQQPAGLAASALGVQQLQVEIARGRLQPRRPNCWRISSTARSRGSPASSWNRSGLIS